MPKFPAAAQSAPRTLPVQSPCCVEGTRCKMPSSAHRVLDSGQCRELAASEEQEGVGAGVAEEAQAHRAQGAAAEEEDFRFGFTETAEEGGSRGEHAG